MAATTRAESCLLVIFGASGDLTGRKLIPALYELDLDRKLPERFAVLGVARSEMSDEAFRQKMREGCSKLKVFQEDSYQKFAQRLHYQAGDSTKFERFDPIKDRVAALGKAIGTGDNVLFYLSMAPQLYESVIVNLGASGLITEGQRWCSLKRDTAPWQRIIVEKPFGNDLDSAAHLNRVLGRVFEEEAIYRIDHYLGKETVQNLLVFRFANSIFEPLWNRDYVDYVQITAAETVGVEGRGSYYDHAGAMRDMIQSHLLQIMAVFAMEAPNSMRAGDLRIEQRKVLEAARVPTLAQVPHIAVRGQYESSSFTDSKYLGYLHEPGVNAQSATETYAAMKVYVDNWRWMGVPFYLRTGKRMYRKLTQIVLYFKPTPHALFREADGVSKARPNRLVINVQPDEGISLRFEGKVPGPEAKLRSAVMDFDYLGQFGGHVPEAYGHLLLDAMRGDQSLFKDRHEIEASWRIVMPVLQRWAEDGRDGMQGYPVGSWGPVASEALFAGHGHWHNPEGEMTRYRKSEPIKK
jgi:glucose-6-phosphate 1-dehydrogenase